MPLSFEVRDVGGIPIIDWSMRGGHGCKPATSTEIELLSRIAELETAIRDLKREHESPVNDYALRATLRKKLFSMVT